LQIAFRGEYARGIRPAPWPVCTEKATMAKTAENRVRRGADPPGRAVVAMSGGVDSTFAAWALVRAGVEIIGVHFKMGDFDSSAEGTPRCCSIKDAKDARRMAELLGIPFYVINMSDEFEKKVVDPFIRAYVEGLTPNPCIYCNPGVKWARLLELSDRLGADAVATGHLARIEKDPATGAVKLLKGADRRKDQSYFLARLEREHLERAVLPAGALTKDEIRKTLLKESLPVAEKPESQDVCFVGDGEYAQFLERRLGKDAPPEGEIVDPDGKVIGRHKGIHRYTVGQRKGLSIFAPEPYYVLAIDPETNRLVAGPAGMAWTGEAEAFDLHWIGEPPRPGETVSVKVRYKSRAAACRVEMSGRQARIEFLKPTRAVAPGQAAVFYRGDEVVGCGTLARNSASLKSAAGFFRANEAAGS